MEQFIVSARKYRPDTFESLIGQENIARTLKNSIQRGQLAHAYLFCGPRGVGKTTTARIFAKSINCLNPGPDMEPCGKCESCLSFAEGRSYCIHELDAASNNSVDDIRNLTEMVRIPPQVGKYSVYIIDEVHMLSSAAFNAFLKTLEEPPAHAVFILATTEKHKILPTILSRCQTFDFNRISVPDIVGNLESIAAKEGISIDRESLHVIAVKADGAMRDALTIFDQIVAFCGRDVHYEDVIRDLNVLDYEYYFKIVDNSLAGDYMSSLLLFDEILSKGFNAMYFVTGLSSHLRDLLVCRNSDGSALLSLPPSMIERYREQASRCSVQFIFNSLNITMGCEAAYRQSGNQRLLIEFALMRMAEKALPQEQTPAPAPAQARVQAQPKAPSAPQPQEQSQPQPKSSAPVQTQASVPAPVSEAPAPASAPKQKMPGLSLKDMLAKARTNEVEGKDSAENLVDEPLSFEGIMNAWQELAGQERAAGRSAMSTAMLLHSPGIDIESGMLTFYVSNVAQQDWINEKALPRMESFMRKALRNKKIKIDVQIYDSGEGAKASTPYMPTDKARFLIEKKPELQELVKDLDLDIK
ncbi:MAG TPA: DNA polymerase III subunit gamma/tau [Candidatus Coprenecus stercoravium]|uniref:DNA polymerase III subunit gamma/tau n=1 Tax=Candidatus Coprenecus stercoravium TaxID=2840735 RepID=A0A9D2GR84_9BACT|nr:DNA polymerase III subunit gamma/tau [Candidatus Coprenecus stercoravium]